MKNIKRILCILLIFLIGIIFVTGCSITNPFSSTSSTIEFVNKDLTLKSGESYQLEKKDTNTVVLYKSSDSTVVSVNEITGYITAHKVGTATITIYEKGKESNKDECTVNVISNSSTPVITTYTLIYDANGGTVSPTSKTISKGNTYGSFPTPTRSGYTFTGWYTEASGGTKANSSTKIYNDVTLYAHWKENGTTPPTETPVTVYTLTYNANGGTVSPTSKNLNNGSVYGTLPTPTRSGHTFTGWYTEAGGGSQVSESTKITGNTTIYAHWKKNEETPPEPTPTIKTIDIRNKAVKAYFNDSKRKIVNICSSNKCNSKLTCDDPSIYKSSITGNIKLYSYNSSSKKKTYLKTVNNDTLHYNLVPGNTYYLESESNASTNEYIKVKSGLRMIDISGVRNVRDLGGWNADGGTVKYGRIFRSANPNKGDNNTVSGLQQINVNVIVDLRRTDEIAKDKKPVNYSGLNKVNISTGSYSPTANNVRKAIKEIMTNVVNGKNVLFHCAIGTDRTGTIAFLLEGILGLSKNNLLDDYEISTFYLYGNKNDRVRTNNSITKLYNAIKSYGSNDQERFINWYISSSKTESKKQEDLNLINNFRKAMINGSPKTYKLSSLKAVVG